MKKNRPLFKITTVLLSLFLLISFTGCCNTKDNVVVEFDIISAQYLLITYEDCYEEVLNISYIDDGEYCTVDITPDYDLIIGNKNKVIKTNPDSFWGYNEYMLTPETYNEIINASPKVYEIE